MKKLRCLFAFLIAIALILSQTTFALALDEDTTEPDVSIVTVQDDTITEPNEGPEHDVKPNPVDSGTDTEEPGEGDEPPDVVYDEAGLAEWINAHEQTGGTVYLGDSVTITKSIYTYFPSSALFVIDTGPYGVVYDGNAINLSHFQIIGEGVDTPVLEVINTGYHYMGGNQNNDIITENITAYGREGIGGTAVRISALNGNFSFDYLDDRQGLIQSFGDGAVGLELPMQAEVYCLNISVEGENSTAVFAPMGANINYCKLKAIGSGATAATGGELVLDTCAAQPEGGDFTVIKRYISPDTSKLFYMPARQYAEYVDLGLFSMFNFTLESGSAPIQRQMMITWDGALYGVLSQDAVDTSAIGRITVSGRLIKPFEGLGLEENCPLELIVDVRDPAVPCIGGLYIDKMWGSDGFMAALMLWESYDPADDGVHLWRSDDNGATWYEFKDSPDIEWYGDTVVFYFSELTSPVRFQLEVEGVGESNVATISMNGGNAVGDTGGDRTGVDRIIGKKPGGEQEDDNGETNTPPGEDGNSGGGNGGHTNGDDETVNGGSQPSGDNAADTPNSNTPVPPIDIPRTETDHTEALPALPILPIVAVIPINKIPAINTGAIAAALTDAQDDDTFASSEQQPDDSVIIMTDPVPLGGLDEPTAANPPPAEQIPLSDSFFSAETFMAVFGGAALLLFGTALWIKKTKLHA